MPVEMTICWELVICVAWWETGRDTGKSPRTDCGGWEVGLEVGKCGESSKGRRVPPSRESETCTLVSLVMRERVWVRREGGWVVRSMEPMLGDGRIGR